ncbi:glycerophosphodiester phosphodiesterase [Saccharopolyspora erythraea]|uniref:glycerophosphodiester phosphodiesterase n=1 Tax=Saccharopolyspora erythraea TaxID=1836 RepID=UPI001BAB111A|nr:glycerophosphodiester phosphodiesterase [Saccharopolyspora erythraea]QUG99617.1 glycerophosphodiester phosphodiesterase [Saccharopolyspora erythraea]
MNDAGWLHDRPIAHRGRYDESAGIPENSLAAFRAAVERGTPFEFDVQLTADGVAVVAHDANLRRVTGEDVLVAESTHARIRRLRTGSGGEPVPTLDDVLEVAGGRVPVVVDVRRWGVRGGTDLERVVAASLRGYRGAVALQSFDPRAVLRLRRLTADHPVGQASGSLPSAAPALRWIGRSMLPNVLTRPDFVSYELAALPCWFADRWRTRTRPLIAFTAHSQAEAGRALQVADNYFYAGFTPDEQREEHRP